jgi:hypothetical protein
MQSADVLQRFFKQPNSLSFSEFIISQIAQLQKKKSVSGLGSLFKRGGKKEETQQVVIVVNDKPSGELSFDVTQPCAALRKKLATTKIVRKKKKILFKCLNRRDCSAAAETIRVFF